jgi:hypothetical protein
MKKNYFVRLILTSLILSQTSFGTIALADSSPSPTPSPAVSPSPNPSPIPQVSPSPAPTPSPAISPSLSPTVSPSPSPSPSPSASPEPINGNGKKTTCTETGPCGPTGTVPDWVYNTTTSKWEASDKTSFTFDAASGYWLSPKYYLNKAIGWYEIVSPADVTALPAGFITAPNVVHTALGDVVVGSKDYEVAKALGIIPSGSSATISGTGENSLNTVGITNATQSWFDLTNLVNVINTLDSSAKSGNVSATDNTHVGSAVSGAANVLANLINLLTSAWSWSSGGLNMFMQNLFGNINGNIKLNPSQTTAAGGGSLGSSTGVANTGAGSTNSTSLSNSNSLGVNASNNGNIVNNVTASAVSGNASANKNTEAGNVASGNATAEVNIINLINSYISSGSSFFGILNIFGNLNGDVLFPQGFLNGAVTSGAPATPLSSGITSTGSGSDNQSGTKNSDTTALLNNSSFGLTNNIKANAASGQTSADSNTSAGNVASGAASTTGSNFNFTNNSLFGDNAVLVIVNVLGHWIGKIMTVPGGSSTSALLTGNAVIKNTGAESNNQAAVSNANTAQINETHKGSITNNVDVQANSGKASAAQNTIVGNVTSGTAKVATGVSNIVNSVINVKHWFGVLIVNVFGSWTGDVGDHSSPTTAAPLVSAVTSPSRTFLAPTSTLTPAQTSQLELLPVSAVTPATQMSTSKVKTNADGKVLAATAPLSSHIAASSHARNLNFIFWGAAILLMLAGMMFSIERRLRNS